MGGRGSASARTGGGAAQTPDPAPGVERVDGVPQAKVEASDIPLVPQAINPSGNPPISPETKTGRTDGPFLVDGDRNRPVTVWHGSRGKGGVIMVRPTNWNNKTVRLSGKWDGYKGNFNIPRSRLTES